MFLLARETDSVVTIAFTFVLTTIENSLAFFAALENLSLFTALDRSRAFPTLTSHKGAFMFARLALPFMTKLRTRMGTMRSSFPSTDLSARMWLNVSFIFWILKFATIAVVLRHNFIILKLALRAAPCVQDLVLILVSVDIQNPCLDTFQMHRNVAARTGPYWVSLSDVLRTNDAVLLFKMTALFLLKSWFFVVVALSWLVVLLALLSFVLSLFGLHCLLFIPRSFVSLLHEVFWLLVSFIKV